MRQYKENDLIILEIDSEDKLIRRKDWPKGMGVESIDLCEADTVDNYEEFEKAQYIEGLQSFEEIMEEIMETVVEEPLYEEE